MRRERALHLYIQLMGCGGTVNRLLVDTIEEGIVQNFGHGALPIKGKSTSMNLEQETRRTRLARDVALGEEPETFTDQNRGGAFGIVDVHGERGATVRPGKKRITEVYIYFGHQQGGEDFDELGGDLAQFHDHQFGNPESNVVIMEQLLDAVWIAYDDAGDGGIG
jgi:hypothetical protein